MDNEMSLQDTNEMQDSQPVEELDLEQQDPSSEATEQGEIDWMAKAKELETKNKQLYARLKKQPKEEKPEEKKPLKKEDELALLRSELQEVRLGQSNPKLSAADIKKAISYAKAEGQDPQDFINSDFFQAYLSNKAQKEAAAKSSPNPSNRSGSARTDFSSVTEADIRSMSDAEYEKYQEHLTQSAGRSKSGLVIRRSH